MTSKQPIILLTNDDGIGSPGLWAAAYRLDALGKVFVVAPRDQFTGAGRSLPNHTDGQIKLIKHEFAGKTFDAFSVGGSPAQAVLHALFEILPHQPALVVSGINYGENVGTSVTISGTVGAAMEAASFGIPALAVSLETEQKHHLSYSTEVDFSTAAHFTHYFARQILEDAPLPEDVDILKVEVPATATPNTSWRVTRLSKDRFYTPIFYKRTSWDAPAQPGYKRTDDIENFAPDTDAYALSIQQEVSVTPLSLDFTSRINLQAFDGRLRR